MNVLTRTDILEAKLVREDRLTTWGMVLQGAGRHAISVYRISPNSPASRIGLKPNDVITEIGDTSTEGMSQLDALQLIGQYGLSIVLTIERKASGKIPVNPIMHGTAPSSQLKAYQTYNMSSGQAPPTVQAPPIGVNLSPSAQNINANTTQNYTSVDHCRNLSCPTDQRNLGQHQQQQQPPTPDSPHKVYQTFNLNGAPEPTRNNQQHNYKFQALNSRSYSADKPSPRNYRSLSSQNSSDYSTPTSPECDTGLQSRTFNVLRNMMEQQEDGGAHALPQQRSAAFEKKRERNLLLNGDKVHEERVQVLRPTTYNTPISMYSPQNMVRSFTSQVNYSNLPDGDDL